MAKDLFSLTIFFVVFREALESSLIISVLLGLVEQILHKDPDRSTATSTATQHPDDAESIPTVDPRVIKKLRLQVFLGALVGLVSAIAIGGAFIAIWFTQAQNLWVKAEQLWEGIFEIIAAVMIFIMGVTMLKLENARAKWRVKLHNAFSKQHSDGSAKASKYVLFFLPMVTILREGLEAVVFVGGVALGEPGSSIPIATIVGIICGIICGFVVYHFASRSGKIFLICMTNLLFLIGAGLFSRAIWAFQENAFLKFIGSSSDEAGGTGPGSYDVRGNVWHLDCCKSGSGTSWSIFNAVLGWQNSATLGSVLSYVFYWLAVIAVLVYYKFREGRTTIFGWESAKGKQRRLRREVQEAEVPPEKELQVETVAVGLSDSSAGSEAAHSNNNSGARTVLA